MSSKNHEFVIMGCFCSTFSKSGFSPNLAALLLILVEHDVLTLGKF